MKVLIFLFAALPLTTVASRATTLDCAVEQSEGSAKIAHKLKFNFDHGGSQADVSDVFYSDYTHQEMNWTYAGSVQETSREAKFSWDKRGSDGTLLMSFVVSVNRATLQLVGGMRMMGNTLPWTGTCKIINRPVPQNKF